MGEAFSPPTGSPGGGDDEIRADKGSSWVMDLLGGEPRAAQGSTKDYCSAWPAEGHHMVAHIGGNGPVRTVERCGQCGWIDFEALNDQYTNSLPAREFASMLRLITQVRASFGDDWAMRPSVGRIYVVAEIHKGRGWNAGYIDVETATWVPLPAERAVPLRRRCGSPAQHRRHVWSDAASQDDYMCPGWPLGNDLPAPDGQVQEC